MTNNDFFSGSDILFRTEFGCKSFRDYINIVESYFITEIDYLKIEHKSALTEIQTKYWEYTLDEANNIEGQIIDKMYEMDVEFRNRFRSSIIIQLFSFLEHELKNLCEESSKNKNIEFIINNIQGQNDLDKIKMFIKRNFNKDITQNTKRWSFINDLRKLRNKLVHNEFIYDNDKDFKSLKKFSKENFLFQRNFLNKSEYKITLQNSDFLKLCVNQVEIFLIEVRQT